MGGKVVANRRAPDTRPLRDTAIARRRGGEANERGNG